VLGASQLDLSNTRAGFPIAVAFKTAAIRASARASQQCWHELLAAAMMGDDRHLWFVWKKNFPLRFWRDLNVPGVGALCAAAGLEYSDLLRRITAYDMSLDSAQRAEEEQRVRDSQRPPPAH
jgi:hypothetical protein